MVTKMEKFTQKEYDDLRTILTDINMHPGIIVYKDDEENKILEKLYNWFSNNTYETIECVSNIDESVENILNKIYVDIQKIRDDSIDEKQFKIRLAELKNYYDKLESIFEKIEQNDLKIIKLLKFINADSNYKITIKDLIDKIKQYNIQANNASNDLANYKKEALADIERERKDFTQSLNDYKNDIEKTKNNLINQYNELKEYHENTKNEIYSSIDDIQNSVNREQLAAYFLNERKKLKGDLNIPVIIYTFLLETIYFLKVDYYITASWHQFVFLRIYALAICIFILLLPLVQFLCDRYIEKNNEVTIKPFEELKALLTPYWCWLGLTFIGMVCIAKVAYALYYVNSTKIDHFDPYLLLANLPIFMILVWFTWFSSKQFSYTKQICDEYEYKYALSKSYLSYRDEAKKISLNDEDKGKYEAVIVALLKMLQPVLLNQ